jgi:hypothetical protein
VAREEKAMITGKVQDSEENPYPGITRDSHEHDDR